MVLQRCDEFLEISIFLGLFRGRIESSGCLPSPLADPRLSDPYRGTVAILWRPPVAFGHSDNK